MRNFEPWELKLLESKDLQDALNSWLKKPNFRGLSFGADDMVGTAKLVVKLSSKSKMPHEQEIWIGGNEGVKVYCTFSKEPFDIDAYQEMGIIGEEFIENWWSEFPALQQTSQWWNTMELFSDIKGNPKHALMLTADAPSWLDEFDELSFPCYPFRHKKKDYMVQVCLRRNVAQDNLAEESDLDEE